MTVHQRFVTEKLTILEKYRVELAQLLEQTDEAIAASSTLQYAAERLFQLMVDAMVDVNRHLIGELNLPAPDDLFSTFRVLGEHHVLDADFANKLAPIVGVRNMLVHQYEKLDQVKFLKNLRQNFADFTTYKNQIIAALESPGKSE